MRVADKPSGIVLHFLSRKDESGREPGEQPGGLRRLGSPKFVSVALRLFSLALILAATWLLSIDMLSSLEAGGQLTVRSLQQVWQLASADSYAQFGIWLRGHDGMAAPVATFLALPGWGVTGVLGVLIAFLAGRHPEH
ncbi:MAG TPA: hypothetical protein VG891_11220 [Rhizomicrobium sp.]|nr:hypothetical protein [Rhizomicrobium sp.]